MCGRYTLFRLELWLQDFPFLTVPGNLLPHFNIAPTQAVLAITNEKPPRLDLMRWGLIPTWAKDPSIGQRMINARAETLAEKPAFKAAYRRRRCLIPADGFYEWRKEGRGAKTPMYAHMLDDRPFAMAGLWETWHLPDGSALRSATIITTKPNSLMAPIHDRMPAIVRKEDYARWLDPTEVSPEALAEVLAPYPAELMTVHPVSDRVNRPASEGAELIAPAAQETLF